MQSSRFTSYYLSGLEALWGPPGGAGGEFVPSTWHSVVFSVLESVVFSVSESVLHGLLCIARGLLRRRVRNLAHPS